MRTEEVLVTPNVAKAWLANNKSNRPVSREAVDRYARDMAGGRWRRTHQGLLIGSGMCVIDGQHRLMSIVKSGVPQMMLVSFDDSISDPLDLPIDTGNKRHASFILGSDNHLVGVASLALKVVDGIRVPTSSDMRPVVDMFGPFYTFLVEGKKDTRRGVTTSGVILGALARIITGDAAQVQYVKETFNAMKMDRFNEMPPIAASFYKQVVVERDSFTQNQILSRAVRMFEPSKSHLTKLTVKDEDFAFQEARILVKKAINQRKEQ